MTRTWLSWSSGKDSAWALKHLLEDSSVDLCGLVCTINRSFERVAMHAVRVELVSRQARALGLELKLVDLPWPCSNEDYEEAMDTALTDLEQQGVERIAFGDLFLQDVRDYRVSQLNDFSIEPMFPLWGRSTRELADEMIHDGLRAVLTCVDPKQIDENFSGRHFDQSLLRDLPAGADPCGENGEFHTFVYDGPMFSEPIEIETGERVMRDGFCFTDVRSKGS